MRSSTAAIRGKLEKAAEPPIIPDIQVNQTKFSTIIYSRESTSISRDLWQEKLVAIKKTAKRSAYKNEKKIFNLLAQHQHDPDYAYIVKVYARVESAQSLIMEYAQLGSLAAYFHNRLNPTFSWPERIDILKDIGKSIRYLHKLGIIHRDIKSANILLFKHERSFRAKLCDFDIACLTTNIKAEMIGTINYMAPEVLDDYPHSKASDVFSYAQLMYEVASGKAPFVDAKTNYHVLIALRLLQFEPIPEHTPPGLARLITGGRHIDPAQRPHIEEIITELDSETILQPALYRN